jgi:sulfate transport system substrate-binding protein
VDKYVAKHRTEELAKAYLEYLYSEAGQVLAVKHFFRPSDPALLAKESARFKSIRLFTVEEIFGSWKNAQQIHFRDGGVFDQIYKKP